MYRLLNTTPAWKIYAENRGNVSIRSTSPKPDSSGRLKNASKKGRAQLCPAAQGRDALRLEVGRSRVKAYTSWHQDVGCWQYDLTYIMAQKQTKSYCKTTRTKSCLSSKLRFSEMVRRRLRAILPRIRRDFGLPTAGGEETR
jgi:hypothetical protein